MRCSASEKLEIIELVEQSTLSVGRTLARLGFQDRRSTTGTADIRTVGRKPWTTDIPSQIASGTAFQMTFVGASSSKLGLFDSASKFGGMSDVLKFFHIA
jgi:hypothetical protein